MNYKRTTKTFIIIFVLALLVGSLFYFLKPTKIIDNKILSEKIIQEDAPAIQETTIFFIGDMMLDRGVEASVKKNFGGDFSKLFENLAELKSVDILFANLEGPVSDVGNNVGSKYSFRMDPIVLPIIKNAGFDIVSFANNHIGDWNVTAFNDTLKRLDQIGIKKIGANINKAEVEKPTIIEKNSVRFGFLGFSDVGPAWMEAGLNKPGILLASDPRLPEIITNAKKESDVLIVSYHFGDEYKTVHNARQESLAHQAIDSGADMVIGHHPHVAEDIAEYKGKPIVYSLGNFIFDQYFSKDTMRGLLFKATFLGSTLKKTETKIITLNKFYQPEGIFSPSELREYEELASGVCPKPTKEFEDMSLLNVDRNSFLPDPTYVPNNLRPLEAISSALPLVCLSKDTRDNFELLTAAARADGLTIKASSGYRSFGTQKNIFDNAINSGKIDTDTSIAKAGYSEHQLGTAIDITGKSINYSSANGAFVDTIESAWLIKNSARFGFILSYPAGQEEITGYKYEPWHYRYVGVESAKEIIKSGKTLNQYLAK